MKNQCRPVDRIPRMIKKLEKIWKKIPDMRLGQLVIFLNKSDTDLFYVEDNEIEKEMDKNEIPTR